MTLYKIIESLRTTQGTKAKQAILDANKDNELLREYMKAVFDPAINYYQSNLPKFTKVSLDIPMEFGFIHLCDLDVLVQRKVTGNAAKDYLVSLLSNSSDEAVELVSYVIKRKIGGANVGETMVLNTWPELFFCPPYQRCSLMDAKVKAAFDKLPFWFVQSKLDGSFAYLKRSKTGSEAITRNGSIYPTWLSEKLSKGVSEGSVVVGEMLVYKDGKVLSRKEGNGLLNSVLQGADQGEFSGYNFMMTAWDLLTEEEFKRGSSSRKYIDRFKVLSDLCLQTSNINLVAHWNVTSMEEAYKIYAEHLARGEEGCIVKNPNALWKDGTSKGMVKLKLEFEADYVITGVFEGNGKYEGMLGGYNCETSDGMIKFNVGSGFTDVQRELDDSVIGKIVTVKANDIILRDGSETESLFLPIFIEIRNDKKEADSRERVMEQLQAAKEGR